MHALYGGLNSEVMRLMRFGQKPHLSRCGASKNQRIKQRISLIRCDALWGVKGDVGAQSASRAHHP